MPTYRLAIKPWIRIKCLHTGWAKQTCTKFKIYILATSVLLVLASWVRKIANPKPSKIFCAQHFMYPKSLWRASSKRQYICHLEEALYITIKNIWSLWNDPWFSWKTHFIVEKHEALHSDWSPGIWHPCFWGIPILYKKPYLQNTDAPNVRTNKKGSSLDRVWSRTTCEIHLIFFKNTILA